MAQSANLKATPREKLGSRSARKLRAAGQIPITLPVEGEKPRILHMSIDRHEFLATRRHHVHLYDIEFGGESEAALVRELQWNAMGDQIDHIDFKNVQRGVETEADVPVVLLGTPKDGQINLLVSEITLRMLPKDIPDSIEVPVAKLETGDHVRASDLVLPEGVKLGVEPELEIAVVSHEQVIVEAVDEEETEPEVIDEKPAEDAEGED